MFPELVSIGPFTLRTFSVFLAFAFIVMTFLFWRKGREEHFDLGELFDVYFSAWLLGYVGSRAIYILLHQEVFGMHIGRWFDFVSFPGFSGLFCILIAGAYLYWQAQKNEWDSFELLDFFALAVSHGLVFIYIGQFLDGMGIGTVTQLPVGVLFPGLQEAHHPTQLYAAVIFFIIARALARAEYRYRTFEWFRSGKKTAQTGFLISVFLMTSGLTLFVLSMFKSPEYVISSVGIDPVIGGILFCAGSWILFVRSGRGLQKRKATHYEA